MKLSPANSRRFLKFLQTQNECITVFNVLNRLIEIIFIAISGTAFNMQFIRCIDTNPVPVVI